MKHSADGHGVTISQLRIFLPVLLAAVMSICLVSHADDTGAAATEARSADDEYPRATLKASDGSSLSLAESRGKVATVLVCMSIECPISNEFLPAIKAVADKYAQQGVRLIGINASAGETLEMMADYARKHDLKFPFVKDEGGKVARGLLFSVTPEVRVFDPAGKIVYQGRIDDRYRAGGGQPGAKITNNLADALDALIAGESVSQSRTRPVGCPLQISAR